MYLIHVQSKKKRKENVPCKIVKIGVKQRFQTFLFMKIKDRKKMLLVNIALRNVWETTRPICFSSR